MSIIEDREEMELSPLPLDDISLVYGKSDALRKNAITEILRNKSFLLSSEGGYTVIAGGNLEKTVDLFSGLIVGLEREYGKAFTRALMSMILSRLTLEEIRNTIRARFSEGSSHEEG